jgi:hypothetical protein
MQREMSSVKLEAQSDTNSRKIRIESASRLEDDQIQNACERGTEGENQICDEDERRSPALQHSLAVGGNQRVSRIQMRRRRTWPPLLLRSTS